MKAQEHIVAIVDPTRDEDSTIDLAQEVVERGGRATVIVLASKETMSAIADFARSEDLTVPDATEIYLERLTTMYATRFGGQDAPTIFTNADAGRFVFDTAARSAATVVAMPQRLASRRAWKASVTKPQVPVLVAPPKAAERQIPPPATSHPELADVRPHMRHQIRKNG